MDYGTNAKQLNNTPLIIMNRGKYMIFKANATLLEAIVLSVVSVEDIYGYRITQEMRGVIQVSESTLYPVLRRLKSNGFLESYGVKHSGKMRCYYKITEKGKTQLALYREEWQEYTAKIDTVLDKSYMPVLVH
jgi:PadR family transcriptional regulator PadR